VWGSTFIGAWTQLLCVPAHAIHAVAARASIEKAAVLAMPYGTSLYALRERDRL
jgi:NADPH:quinone reductase-like Zn-dependent oxidoreductase